MNTSQPINPARELLEEEVRHAQDMRNLQFDAGGKGADVLEREFQKAKRHTRKVRVLKLALPVLAVFIILGIIGALLVNSLISSPLNLENISISDGKLIMENPKLKGVDGENRPYTLEADSAVQNVEDPTKVQLTSILAELPVDEDVSATLRAGNGLYDTEAKTLRLTNSVFMETTDGMSIKFQEMDVDIAGGYMKTDSGVFAKSEQAEISSKSLVVEDRGKRVIFDGGVTMTLYPGNLRKEDASSE